MAQRPSYPEFNMWRDYLGLNKVLRSIVQERRQVGIQRQEEIPQPAPNTPSASPITPPGEQQDNCTERFLCSFCKHNGEPWHVYRGHNLRDRQDKVICPILRSYICPQCGATGDNAHTKRFCPRTNKNYTSVYRNAESLFPPK
ncbi:nanos homolog 3 [Pyxicephalus adspersus]|uniref:nanos homolog 3 n=1 Tax=Pyxicephalus adspersus TaxID=30357 RepID=UPI003B5C1111